MSYNDIRPIFEKIWDFNQNIVPMDAEKGSKQQKSPEKERSPEKIVEEKDVTQEEKEEVVKKPGTKRKKSIPKKSTRKRQKMEEDSEKEELKEFLDIIPREEVPIEVESISTKFPIVDWKSYVLTETFMYYQVFRGDGSSKNYKIFTEMLRDFDRHDVEELYRLVKERYRASSPEGYDLMLWGDLHTMFEPNEDDELWKNQHQYNLLSWSLYDFCGIHMLLMENGMAIHMLTEKKYPLSQEMISKMLKKRLEVDHESTQAIELLRFIRSQNRSRRGINTAPSTSSTNDVNTAGPQVSTASPNVNTASPQVSTVSFSDNVVYAFMVKNPNGSNLLHQNLEQIHEDDLEAIDLKWQLSLLSIREKRYYQRTGKKILINANDTARYDKSKVECFNCHKMGYFARECRAPRSKEGQFKNQDNTRKQGNNKDTSSKAMLAIDGVGFDWSEMAEEQVQTNIALMAFSDSKNIDQFLNGFTQPTNEIDMDDLEPDEESVDTPLFSPFLDSDDDSDDGEVLNELEEYGNALKLCRQRAISI
ncbi:ribonuclease H-like domain-containing protein [Tanacetum coccineum]